MKLIKDFIDGFVKLVVGLIGFVMLAILDTTFMRAFAQLAAVAGKPILKGVELTLIACCKGLVEYPNKIYGSFPQPVKNAIDKSLEFSGKVISSPYRVCVYLYQNYPATRGAVLYLKESTKYYGLATLKAMLASVVLSWRFFRRAGELCIAIPAFPAVYLLDNRLNQRARMAPEAREDMWVVMCSQTFFWALGLFVGAKVITMLPEEFFADSMLSNIFFLLKTGGAFAFSYDMSQAVLGYRQYYDNEGPGRAFSAEEIITVRVTMGSTNKTITLSENHARYVANQLWAQYIMLAKAGPDVRARRPAAEDLLYSEILPRLTRYPHGTRNTYLDGFYTDGGQFRYSERRQITADTLRALKEAPGFVNKYRDKESDKERGVKLVKPGKESDSASDSWKTFRENLSKPSSSTRTKIQSATLASPKPQRQADSVQTPVTALRNVATTPMTTRPMGELQSKTECLSTVAQQHKEKRLAESTTTQQTAAKRRKI